MFGLCPENLEQLVEVGDRVIGHAVLIGLLALVRIEHHGLQAGFPCPEDVTVHVVADVQRVPGRDFHPVERMLEEPPVGFAVAVVPGHDDRVEVVEQADPVQFTARVRALRIGDESKRVALAQDIEHLADMRVQAEPAARDAAGHLGQEQRHLVELGGGQVAGETRLVLIDDAVPDSHRVEFGMLLRTGVLLLAHDPEIQLSDLIAAQIYALVGEEVRRAAEDLVHAFIGLDPDQGAVHVERDRPNIHACILPDRSY